MPSQLIVKEQKVNEIIPHTNADKLEIAKIGAWETCIQKGEFQVGERCLFIPPDAILPHYLHNFLGISKYCKELPKNTKERKEDKRRITATRLRGVRSFGTVISWEKLLTYCKENDIELDEENIASSLDITKYTPPEKCTDGDATKPNNFFYRYTNIENIRNFPDIFNEGEEVVASEKTHGCLEKSTKILLSDGTEKNIENMQEGDLIISYDVDRKTYVEDVVQKIIMRKPEDSKWIELSFDNGRSIICTENHLFFTENRGWVEAINLSEKDTIL